MANKSFVVQYIIKAREKYVAVAQKVAKSTDRMKKSMDDARTSLNKFGSQSKKVGAIMTAAVSVPIGLLFRSLKNAARDANETRSKFGTVFRDISKQSESMANALAKNYGLGQTQSRKLLGDTGDLLTGFGFTQNQALDLSNQVNQLAVDLASFTNYSGGAEGASAALTKALLGERESIKSLGIAISEENVKDKIRAMVKQGYTFATLRQAKAEATLALALEQSKNAIGDFSRTQDQLANQERILAARTQDLKEEFGKALLPVALSVTKSLQGLVAWLNNTSPATKKVILVVAGLAAVIGPLALFIGGFITMLPILAAGFGALGTAVTFAFGPIGLLIAGLVAGGILIYKHWDKIKSFFMTFFNFIKEKIQPAIDKLSNIKLPSLPSLSGMKSKLFGGGTITQDSNVNVGVEVGLAPGLMETKKPTTRTRRSQRRADVGLATAGA